METVSVRREEVTEKELRLIGLLRQIPFGETTIQTQNGQPVRVVRVEESIKL